MQPGFEEYDLQIVRKDFVEGKSAILEKIESLLRHTLDIKEHDKKLINHAMYIFCNLAATGNEYVAKIIKESNMAYFFTCLA